MRKHKFKFLMKTPTRSESARCGELKGLSAHLDAFLKSALFLLAAALLTLGSFFSQAYGVSSTQHQEEEDFSYVSYKLEAVQVAEVLLEIGVSPEKVEEVLGSTSLSESQKLTLLFHETKGLWVFDTSKHGPPVILIACKWYQLACIADEVADYANRVVTSAADDLEEAAEEVSDYANRVVTSAVDDAEEVLEYGEKVVTSARDDIEEILGTDDKKKKEKKRKKKKKSSKKDQDLPAERSTVKVSVLGVGVEHSSEKNTDLTGADLVEMAKQGVTEHIKTKCTPDIECKKDSKRDRWGNCCEETKHTFKYKEPEEKGEPQKDFSDINESELPEAIEAPPEEPREIILQRT